MGRRKDTGTDRARLVLAQEAARIIAEQGIGDFRQAKAKAAARLGMRDRGSLPGNAEIDRALGEHLLLFGRQSHVDLLALLRRAALSAMEILAPFSPRLVGPVLHGTAAVNSSVSLHVFADHAEQVGERLEQHNVNYRSCETRLKSRRDRVSSFAGYRFMREDAEIEATVFPVDGLRQAPISPIDGKPMKRADVRAVEELLK
ncbi:MAG TPA: hypothetical protein VGA68_11515 [Woeseiaceae bacterium]|jgi:hypothetical protein